jgi:hypothetical protein
MSARYWLGRILLPVAGTAGVCLAAGFLPRLWMGPSVWRVLATAGVCEPLFLALTWVVLLDRREKEYVLSRAQGLWRRLSERGTE